MTDRKSTVDVESMVERARELDRALIKEDHRNPPLVTDVELRRAEVFGLVAALNWVLGNGLTGEEKAQRLTEQEEELYGSTH